MNLKDYPLPCDQSMLNTGGVLVVDPSLATQVGIRAGSYQIEPGGEMILRPEWLMNGDSIYRVHGDPFLSKAIEDSMSDDQASEDPRLKGKRFTMDGPPENWGTASFSKDEFLGPNIIIESKEAIAVRHGLNPKDPGVRLLGFARPVDNPSPGVNRMNEKTELLIERAKPGKFALRMRNKETGDSVVVSEGRANEVYDLKEAMERVARAAPGPTGL